MRLASLRAFALGATTTLAGESGRVDTTRSPAAKVYIVDLSDVKWIEGF